eukprot:675810-Alexandrium_andersonii.AAC.1
MCIRDSCNSIVASPGARALRGLAHRAVSPESCMAVACQSTPERSSGEQLQVRRPSGLEPRKQEPAAPSRRQLGAPSAR